MSSVVLYRDENAGIVVHNGDLFAVLPTLEPNSIDSCVCDPPYGLEFMGKDWDAPWKDSDVESERGFQAWCERWATEVLRVLKPGAHLLAFGGTRMFHRLAVGIEDAGFEIRDCLSWLYGSGFPKSLDLTSHIDDADADLAEDVAGIGTALKPGWEPIVLARKPLRGTVTWNVLEHGTGGLNIDACRLGRERAQRMGAKGSSPVYNAGYQNEGGKIYPASLGRWPPNVVIDELAAALINKKRRSNNEPISRFYFVAKASRRERDIGCAALPVVGREELGDGPQHIRGGVRNFHPTIKPVSLMRHLVRLITPKAGIVIDPFLGSGTTGMACIDEQVKFIGIERDAQYADIAARRISGWAPLFVDAYEPSEAGPCEVNQAGDAIEAIGAKNIAGDGLLDGVADGDNGEPGGDLGRPGERDEATGQTSFF